MKKPSILKLVEAYWEGLRPYGDIPNREQVDPRGIETALDFAFLIEVSQTGEPVFRLSGERLGDILGIPLDRVPFTALFSQECQTQVKNALLNVFSSPGILRADLSSDQSTLRPKIDGQLLILPLRHTDNSITRALGVLYLEGMIGRAPRQFTQFEHHMTRVVLGETKQLAQPEAKALGMAENSTNFTHKERRPAEAGRPSLKVIKGGLK